MDRRAPKNIGIGFATGRKTFQQVLKTYAYSWMENGLTEENVRLHVVVAYDLTYNNTRRVDFTNVSPRVSDLIDDIHFVGSAAMQRETDELLRLGVADEEDIRLLFGGGYAGMRNTVLYNAIKLGIDSLLFLDDDEYPLAVTKTRAHAIWSGQSVLSTHLQYIENADITHGHHCGYISPIPHIDFGGALGEADFRSFIEAISNDILSWDNIKQVMDSGGVTYADTNVLISDEAIEVREQNGAKFISGGNLCINLTDPARIFAFYNPPGARGEDTFLSTLLGERKVLRVPCYAFHDGFSTYGHIMDGVLPVHLRPITADDEAVVSRFYRACIGWVRYKPLLLYLTQPGLYDEKIRDMRDRLAETLPKICAYFDKKAFMDVAFELERYHQNVQKHCEGFRRAQRAWKNILSYLGEVRPQPFMPAEDDSLKGARLAGLTGV
ncbi:MAG TPA: hypothetical protein VN369_00885 [Terriglobales bacterium]|nr:hypothetical protein [Terriglobales bacterium]